MTSIQLDGVAFMRVDRKRFQVRRYRLIVLRHRIEGGFGVPDSDRRSFAEKRCGGGSLFGIKNFCLPVLDTVGEIFEKRILGEFGVTVVILNAGPRAQSGGELEAACVVYGAHVGEVAVRTDKH